MSRHYKRYVKKQSTRTLRRKLNRVKELPHKGNRFNKYYDYWWMLW